MIGQREVIYDPHRALARTRRHIPDVETVLVPDCGHLINMEQPALTDERILRFLADHRAGHGTDRGGGR